MAEYYVEIEEMSEEWWCLCMSPQQQQQPPLGTNRAVSFSAYQIPPQSQLDARAVALLLLFSSLVLLLLSNQKMTSNQHATTVFPQAKKPNSISVNGFQVSTQKLPILKAEPIEEMTKKLGIAPPEMIFGDNFVAIEHEKSGWGINFNAFDALDLVDKTGQSMLQVAYSKEWQKSRYITMFSSAVAGGSC